MHPTHPAPTRLDDALGWLAERPDLRPLAGGTDLYPAAVADTAWMRHTPAPMLDLSRVAELAGLADRGDHHRIGARVTWATLRDTPLPAWFDGLRAAARAVGGAQIQNRATLVGNLCNASPAADAVPPLLALDAAIELASRRGVRVLPLAEFLIGNRQTARAADEIATAVLVPRPAMDARAGFGKLGARCHLVISIVMVAGVIEPAGGRVARARLAVGACSAVAQRLPALEAALEGLPIGPALARAVRDEHLTALTPIDDVRATAEYRRAAALVLLRRLLDGLAG